MRVGIDIKTVNQWTWQGTLINDPIKCEAPLQPQAAKDINHRGTTSRLIEGIVICGTTAKYIIQGKYYCRKHGGLFCLDYLTRGAI